MKLTSGLLLRTGLVLCSAVLAGCANTPKANNTQTPIKNLILMIGDGMGPQQTGLLEEYAKRAPSSIYQGKPTGLSTFAKQGFVGTSSHGPYGSLVVDSACSATQIATGIAAGSEMIGLNAIGDPVPTILEKAKAQGKATGLVSDTRMTHATPAAFAAHQAHRSMETAIAEDLLREGDVDVLLSGGLRYFLPQNVASDPTTKQAVSQLINEPSLKLGSKRKDNKNLLEQANKQGYALTFNRQQLASVTSGKVLGLFAYDGMMDGISYSNSKKDPRRKQPSLKEMTVQALEILSKDPDGFFLMIEGGQIDWAAHNNDAGNLLHELLKFDEAIQAVYAWVKDRNDTLVVITADHETGGFGMSYSRRDITPPRSLPGAAFADQSFYPNFNFGGLDNLDKLYQQKKNFYAIWQEAQIDGKQPTPESLMQAVNNNSAYKINLKQAKKILVREKNEYYIAGHKYLKSKTFPKVNDFKEYYVYGDDTHKNLIGRTIAPQQNVVWSTGTHTHTPVQVIAWGPEKLTRSFSSILHHTQLGQMLDKALNGQPEEH